MDVLDLPIRLVVKAPNQQIDDQVIECAITWTVKKLKTYLSEVYPSKPKAEDQKLIYSGQLLPDNLMLKDILRQYDTEVVHTVHLVCMPPKDNANSSSIPVASPLTPSGSPRIDSSSSSINSNNNNDGLRHRSTMGTNNTTRPEQRSQQVPPVVESRSNMWPNSHDLTPEQLNQQMAWMRMYGQYMNYYIMQQYQGLYGVNLPGVQPQAPISPPEVQPIADQGNPNPENIRDRQLNEIRRMNAQGGPVDDDDELAGNRDWLDWVYVFSRLSVLFAIVYFYSSFNRFVMVVLFAVLLYIYQTGVFWRRDRLHRANNNNQERNDRHVAENPQIVNQDAQDEPQVPEEPEMEQMQRETRELEETMDRDTEPNNRVTQQTVSFLHIAWTFVATFFSSLLPQQQDAVNLN